MIGWWVELDISDPVGYSAHISNCYVMQCPGVEGGALKIIIVSFTRVAHLATGCLLFQCTL